MYYTGKLYWLLSFIESQNQEYCMSHHVDIDVSKTSIEEIKLDPFLFIDYNQMPKHNTKLINTGFSVNVFYDFDHIPKVW